MKRSLLATALLVLLAAGAALAAPQSIRTTKIDDPRGDSTPGRADIESITGSVASAKVTFTVTTYNSFTKYTAPCVALRSVSPTGLGWSICRLNGTTAPPCYTSVSSSRPYPAGGGCDGPATISISGKSVTYTVPLSQLVGKWKPRFGGLKWRAEVRAIKGCFPTPCDFTSWGSTAL